MIYTSQAGRSIARFSSVAFACMMLAESVAAGPTAINFEGLADGTSVTTQYQAQGVIFTQATVVTAGLSLNELDFPPHSGSNVVFDDGGAISGVFSSPVVSFGGYFTYTTPFTISGFDQFGNQVASSMSLFANNIASSGHAPNEFLQVNYAGGIRSFTLTGSPSGSSFTLDDFAFNSTPVPEPSGYFVSFLFMLFVGGLAVRARRRQAPH